MANNDEQSNKPMAWFLVILTLMVIALSLTLWWKHSGFTEVPLEADASMKGFQGRQPDRIQKARDIKERLFASLSSAYDNSDSYASESTMSETQAAIENAIEEYDPDLEDLVTVENQDTREGNENAKYNRVKLEINIKKVTQSQLEAIFAIVNRITYQYATVAELTVEAEDMKPKAVAAGMNPSTALWKSDLTLYWFIDNPKYSKGKKQGSGKPQN